MKQKMIGAANVLLAVHLISAGLCGAGEQVYKYAVSFGKGVPVTDSAIVFAEEAEKRSNGAIKIRVYENNSLGHSVEALEATQRGNIEFVGSTLSQYASFTKAFMPLSLPYLFSNKEHAYRFLDSEIGEQIKSAVADSQDLLILGWLENGNRHLFNNVRPIYSPADVAGLKIRVMENPIQMKTIEFMGGLPTPMAMTEQFTALQQGQIDGAENSYQNISGLRLFEVAKYLSETSHFYEISCMAINTKLFRSLSPEHQKILREAAMVAQVDCRERTALLDDKIRKELESQVAINPLTPEQIEVFRLATKPIHAWLLEQNYDPLNKIIMDEVERLR